MKTQWILCSVLALVLTLASASPAAGQTGTFCDWFPSWCTDGGGDDGAFCDWFPSWCTDDEGGGGNVEPGHAPEIDPASLGAAATFLGGGLAVLRGRRRKKK